MIHTMAVLPNAFIGEYFPHHAAFCADYGKAHIDIANGTAMIENDPGLGVQMDEAALARHEV